MRGSKRYVREGLTLSTGQTVALDVKLELGAVNESVTVSASAPLVQSTTSGVNQLIESKRIADFRWDTGEPWT